MFGGDDDEHLAARTSEMHDQPKPHSEEYEAKCFRRFWKSYGENNVSSSSKSRPQEHGDFASTLPAHRNHNVVIETDERLGFDEKEIIDQEPLPRKEEEFEENSDEEGEITLAPNDFDEEKTVLLKRKRFQHHAEFLGYGGLFWLITGFGLMFLSVAMFVGMDNPDQYPRFKTEIGPDNFQFLIVFVPLLLAALGILCLLLYTFATVEYINHAPLYRQTSFLFPCCYRTISAEYDSRHAHSGDAKCMYLCCGFCVSKGTLVAISKLREEERSHKK